MKKPLPRRGRFVPMLLVAGLVSGLIACDVPTAPPGVELSLGAVTGEWSAFEEEPVAAFLGMPFARPPLGSLRWARPEPPQPWAETLVADDSGPACWQDHTPKTTVYSRGEIERSEDCLRLNVWTKAVGGDRLPVMVWFHGGGHTTGSNGARIFEGARLASKGVVLVSANYRLGPLGFLAHPELSAESAERHGVDASGNYGLWDKVAALEWVRDHIEAFGGDPTNVTIFGQSAGSMSVCALMTAAAAEGLFHKVIGQSATCLPPLPARVDGPPERHGVEVAESVGDGTLAALRAATPAELFAASTAAPTPATELIVDGALVERQPSEAFRRGAHHPVPLLVGSMADEETALFPVQELSREQLEGLLKSDFGGRGAAVLDAYAAELESKSPGEVYRKILSDRFFDHATRRWAGQVSAHGQPAWVYLFSRPTPAFLLYLHEEPPLEVEGGRLGLGAYHSGDLAYVFDNQHLVGFEWDERDAKIAEEISSYWVRFATTGDPNGAGLPEWPAYDAVRDQILQFGEVTSAVERWKAERLLLFDTGPEGTP
ncbi:MAG: carboxylesterase family protein [Acidobacteriota bacterium]